MSHRLQVLISTELDQRLEKASQRGKVSKGEWVRQAIERSLEAQAGHRGKKSALERLSMINGPTADIDQMLQEIDRGRA